MKNRLIFLVILILLSFGSRSQNLDYPLNISSGWKFKTGENSEFSKTEYNDSGWQSIKVGQYWETQGFPEYDGYAYYRLKVVIPASMREGIPFVNGLKLSLGKIDDTDVTYFNGHLIGKCSNWDKERQYVIPFDIVNWNKENVIAVKVQDWSGTGGLFEGNYTIDKLKNVSDFITLHSDNELINSSQIVDSTLSKTVIIKHEYALKNLSAQFRVKIIDIESNTVVYNQSNNLIIGTQADSSFSYTAKIKGSGWYKAYYSLTSKLFKDTVASNTLIAYRVEDHSHPLTVKPAVANLIPPKSESFDLKNISIKGYLGARLQANLSQRLLKVDEQGILECFYNRPGRQTWVGEYTGKYLHAASKAWRNSSDSDLKAQMDRIVDILIHCQLENGYLGTYLPADYWTFWDVWAHKYDLLGLLSYYSVTGYQPALNASIKIGNLLCKTFGTHPGQINIEETSEHVGMASTSVLEPMTELYRYTGDKKYLDFCKYIIESYNHSKGPKIISALNTLGKVNKVANAKAYEMMSNFTGIVKLYQLTGDNFLLSAMKIAWNDISTYKLYITGTTSKGERFQEDDVLPAENNVSMGEGCVTTTWIQFSQAMYNLTGECKYIDEIEKSVYNHLLAAENPETGCVAYYTALQGKKPYRCNINAHCCLASVPRAIAAIPEIAYTKNPLNGFNINFYTPGKFIDTIATDNNIKVLATVDINTKFPEEGRAEIRIAIPHSSSFAIRLRVPSWCKNFVANYAGSLYKGFPGEYLELQQKWSNLTEIHVSFDLNFQLLDGGKSYPGYAAIKSGAQILAIDQSLNPEMQDLNLVSIDDTTIFQLPATALPNSWINKQIYGKKALYNGKPMFLKLVPFAEAGQTGGEVRVWMKRK
ncbi:MAG: beta-L-arabinofuranosidase domain-containing protein [Prolixibacteraceae bacterium]